MAAAELTPRVEVVELAEMAGRGLLVVTAEPVVSAAQVLPAGLVEGAVKAVRECRPVCRVPMVRMVPATIHARTFPH